MKAAKVHGRWSVVKVMMGCWTPAVASIKVPPTQGTIRSTIDASSKNASRLLMTVQFDSAKCCPDICVTFVVSSYALKNITFLIQSEVGCSDKQMRAQVIGYLSSVVNGVLECRLKLCNVFGTSGASGSMRLVHERFEVVTLQLLRLLAQSNFQLMQKPGQTPRLRQDVLTN